jgi:hypothetical protein
MTLWETLRSFFRSLGRTGTIAGSGRRGDSFCGDQPFLPNSASGGVHHLCTSDFLQLSADHLPQLWVSTLEFRHVGAQGMQFHWWQRLFLAKLESNSFESSRYCSWSLSLACLVQFIFYLFFKFLFIIFIHMCIQCLGHFSPLPPCLV